MTHKSIVSQMVVDIVNMKIKKNGKNHVNDVKTDIKICGEQKNDENSFFVSYCLLDINNS